MGQAEKFVSIPDVFGSHWLDLCKEVRVISLKFRKLVPTGYGWLYFSVTLQGEEEGATEAKGRRLQLTKHCNNSGKRWQ